MFSSAPDWDTSYSSEEARLSQCLYPIQSSRHQYKTDSVRKLTQVPHWILNWLTQWDRSSPWLLILRFLTFEKLRLLLLRDSLTLTGDLCPLLVIHSSPLHSFVLRQRCLFYLLSSLELLPSPYVLPLSFIAVPCKIQGLFLQMKALHLLFLLLFLYNHGVKLALGKATRNLQMGKIGLKRFKPFASGHPVKHSSLISPLWFETQFLHLHSPLCLSSVAMDLTLALEFLPAGWMATY